MNKNGLLKIQTSLSGWLGALGLDNILKFFFLAKFYLSSNKWSLIYEPKEKKIKIPSKSEDIINFN